MDVFRKTASIAELFAVWGSDTHHIAECAWRLPYGIIRFLTFLAQSSDVIFPLGLETLNRIAL
jgi:hypothetical protein